jgi:hypothetical protein
MQTQEARSPNKSTVTGGQRACPDNRAGREPDEPHDTGPYPRAQHDAVAQAPGASDVRLMAYPSQGAPAASWLDSRILREEPGCRLPRDSLYVAC